MIRKIVFIFSLLLFSNFLFSQSKKYEVDFIDLPANEAIQLLEEKYGLLFSYKKDDLNEVYFSEKINTDDLSSFLENIFGDNGFEFEIVNKNYVLLKKKKIENEIPLYTFCGTIVDSTKQEPLIGATVYIDGTNYGTTSQLNGGFQLKAPLEKGQVLIVSFVGFKTISVPAAQLANGDCSNFIMKEDFQLISGGAIVVTEYLTDGIELTNDGSANILNPNKIGALPGQVEPDIFSTINFLPGISAPTGEHSKFNVRGGASDQNLMLWEGIPIYQPAHYFGMIPSLNPYIIDEIKVYRGGFSSEYGGRISGIVDMKSKKPFGNKPSFGAGFNFLNGYAYGKVPFLDSKGYFTFSARHSINGIWRSPTFENITRRNQQGNIFDNIDVYNLPPHISITDELNFFDTQLKTNIELTEKDEISAAFFYADNEFNNLIIDDRQMSGKHDDLKLNNMGSSFYWKHNWLENFYSKASVIYSKYDQDYNLFVDFFTPGERDYNLLKQNIVQERQINLLNEYTTHSNHIFSFGYQNLDLEVDYLIQRNEGNKNPIDEDESFNSDINTFHAGIKSNPFHHRFGFEAGIRYNRYSINKKVYWEPRARVWYKLNNNLTLTTNAGKYNQFISQLVELKGNQDGIEIPIWIMTGERGRNEPVVLSGEQYQLGAIFQKNNWVIDIQAYAKNINGISSLSSDFDINIKKELGDIKAKGIDILVKKRWKKYRTWLSYSLSESVYEFNDFFDEQFFAPYDQRHTLSWVHLYEKNNFEFSFGLEFTTGNRYSFMKDFRIEEDDMNREVYVSIYDELYGDNLSFQHRADASIRYNFIPNKNKRLKGVIGLSVLNIYDNRNYYARDYFVRQFPNMAEEIQFINKAHVGFTPNMVFRLEW